MMKPSERIFKIVDKVLKIHPAFEKSEVTIGAIIEYLDEQAEKGEGEWLTMDIGFQ